MKQTILIRSNDASGTPGIYNQNLIFRFQPKKLIVRQIGLSGSTNYISCLCRQITPDVLAIAYVAASADQTNPVDNEFDLSQYNLQNGQYTFEFFDTNGAHASITKIMILLEFSD